MAAENTKKKPELVVFAGPNGSGKSTFTTPEWIVGSYINADDIKRTTLCTDLQAAEKADELRENQLKAKEDFTFETVLSTDSKLQFIKRAKPCRRILICSATCRHTTSAFTARCNYPFY